MKFFLAVALAGVALCQQGAQGPAATQVAANQTATAGKASAPTSKPKGKAKGGKKGKKGKTPAPTADAPTPAAEVEITSEPQVYDSSCKGAPIGSLWCAAKRKCLRAWEEPCEQFGGDNTTHVQVKEGSPALFVPRAVAPPATTTTATASIPLYPPTATVVYQPAVAAPLYNATAVAQLAPIGGNTDNGGCYTGAGYSFCATLGICVRPWETPCPDVAPITAPVVPAMIDPVGGQRDANGCVIGAGYSFCASLNTCVRSWETPCPDAAAAVPLPLPIGGQMDAGGCMGGAGYSYCASLARCVRPWETPCPDVAAPMIPAAPIGGSRDAGGCVTGAGYTFCPLLNRCVRPWETPCPV